MSLLKSIDFARKMAKKIQEEFNKNKIDVDVFSIAKKLGVDIVELDFNDDEISGLIKRLGKNGKPVIAINKDHPENRKRFTIAHELGHYILHVNKLIHIDEKSEVVYFRDSQSCEASKIKEIQANQFAAELLMPEKIVKRDIQERIRNGESLDELTEKLAKIYKVSVESMGIRIGKLMY